MKVAEKFIEDMDTHYGEVEQAMRDEMACDKDYFNNSSYRAKRASVSGNRAHEIIK